MRTRIGVVFAVALVAAVAGFFIVRQGQALGQAEKATQLDKPKSSIFRPDAPRPTFLGAQPQRWEYRVLSLKDKDDAANEDLTRMASDGWDYAGVVQSALPPARATAQVVQNFSGTPTRVLFKRLMKKPVDRAEQSKP
jgi:hypothetical protein